MNKSHALKAMTSRLMVLLGALFALALPMGASAQTILATDCSLNFTNVFFDNEPVCAFGQTGGSLLGAPAIACIVPPGAAPNNGNDVTGGGCNAIPFGTFIDVFLWLPPLTPGTYDMVLVNNQGFFAFDSITVLDSGGADPTVNVAAIKAAAFPNIATWEATENFGNYIDDAASAISLAYSLASGDLLGAAVAAGGLVTGFPTDYNGAVLSVGGGMIAALAGQQALYYSTLYDDPPDPHFTDVFPLNLALINDGLAASAPLNPGIPLAYPFENLSEDSLHLTTIELANSLSEEAALLFTLTRTLEKFQGAEEAEGDEFILIQARALKKYADQLDDQLASSRQQLVNYKAELTADGVADVIYDGAEIAAIIDRLNTSGLTPAEEQSLRDGEFDDATGVAASNTYGAPVVTQVGLRVTDTDGNEDINYATVTITAANGAPQITSFAPLNLAPTASALSPLDFSATATDPDMDPLVYEWKVDGAVMSNNQNFTYTPGVGETGTRAVRLAVSDLNPLSLDAIESRVVLLLDQVQTPNVVGLSQALAENAIVGVGLVVGVVTTSSSATVPAGDVISQNPAGGMLVQPGTSVDLVVSIGPAGSPPDAPTGLAGRTKALLVNFNWTPSNGATSYRVFRRLDTELEFTNLGQTPYSAFSNKLPDGTMFAEFYVVAENQFGSSEASEILKLAPVFRDRRSR